jgi:C4-dicarboxylate-specific signal transduction histidine kinase
MSVHKALDSEAREIAARPRRTNRRDAGLDRKSIRSAEAARLKSEGSACAAQGELDRLQRMMSAGQFAAWIAHEINQPISAIVTNSDATLRWLAKETPNLQEAQAAIQRILRDANRAVAVIAGTRAMLARDKPEFAALDINDIVEDVVGLTQEQRVAAGVVVQTSLADELPQVMGDRIQLQQVILNLVLNGMDAMAEVADRPRVLRIRTDLVCGADVRVAVEDCGVGLDPTIVDHLFDDFFTTKADGVGLGLPISRSIVLAHGGQLWANPASENGAVFQFVVPAITA